MTNEQRHEVERLIDYLELKVRQASSPKIRENARRAHDSLTTLYREHQDFEESYRKSFEQGREGLTV